jgi:ATP adenylyltransferase
MSGRQGFEPGSLFARIESASARALAAGALQPIPTGFEFVEDGGVRFFVRVLANLARKDLERTEHERAAAGGKPANPFLPWERDLFVADVSGSHVAILNKFNVVDHHLLVITREFEDQRTLLTPRDFDALWRCMREYESLGFYNGGVAAGASQPHKHLQVVPLPLAPQGPPVPVEPLLAAASRDGTIGPVPGFDFRNALARFGAGGVRADALAGAGAAHALYLSLLGRVGLGPARGEPGELQRGPYCLLVTREWMLIVPRSREHFDSISVNALGFAGALLVRNEEQLQHLRAEGPLRALRETAFPARGDAA